MILERKSAFWAGQNGRQIKKRIIIECDLILQTPAHFGNGDSDEMTDMPLLVDPGDNQTPLLTGATIAGALRSYLRAREFNYRADVSIEAGRESLTSQLFGGARQDDEGQQSALIVEDAYGKAGTFNIELRHGNRLNHASRTADDKALFSYEVWTIGTTFPLRFELLISAKADEQALKTAVATALQGFQDGGITLGARKQRGLGRVAAHNWQIRVYDLAQTDDLLTWLADMAPPAGIQKELHQTLGIDPDTLLDKRHYLTLQAKFYVDSSLLIRSYGGRRDVESDMAHLHTYHPTSKDKSKLAPVLPGTSVGGALRHRALKICRTIGMTDGALPFVEQIFGPQLSREELAETAAAEKIKPFASRLRISEEVVPEAITDWVQNRVSIDRFTGGAREGALFSQQPLFSQPERTVVTITLQLTRPCDTEIGLLLLLLKDLWLGNLPIGGERSVGRGRLQGQETTLTLVHSQQDGDDDGKQYKAQWRIREDEEQGVVTDVIKEGVKQRTLQYFVDSLWQEVEDVDHK